MAIDDVLEGVDPYDLMEAEAARIAAFASALDANGWSQPSACAGWSRLDLLAHLAATEEYFHAGIDGTVADFLASMAAKGAIDVNSANQIGVEERRGAGAEVLLEQWRAGAAATVAAMRARDGGEIDTSVGAYPCRWQAFHIASELATHADDLGVPVTGAEAADRLDWRTRFSVFSLAESKPDLAVSPTGATVHLADTEGLDVTLDATTFVHAVEGRLPPDAELPDGLAARLSTMP